MSEGRGSTDDRHQAARYEIRVNGHLDGRWAAWFEGLSLTHEADGTTVIHGPVADQAALHGLLQKVRDIGLPLVSVIGPRADGPRGRSPASIGTNETRNEENAR